MLNVCMVWTGNKYSDMYPAAWERSISNWMPDIDYRIIPFTDQPEKFAIDSVDLFSVDAEGWWNKLFLFNWHGHNLNGDILFFDLDMVFVGPLDCFCNLKKFTTMSRFKQPKHIDSTVMYIPEGYGQNIWDNFVKIKMDIINKFKGDQDYIESMVGTNKCDRFNVTIPGSIVSFKYDCQDRPPSAARVVSFHGNPKPHEVTNSWVEDNWHA